MRRTKIVATLGPASEKPEILVRMLEKGVNLVRMNFSHGKAEDHQRRIELVRQCAAKINREVGILADLQGPKIRIAKFKEGKIDLKKGDQFSLNADLETEAGDQTQVGIDYKNLPQDVKEGDTLLLDDGRIVLKVKKVSGNCIQCEVEVGGKLSNNKGINRQGGGLSAPALTEKDKADLQTAVRADVDYLAVSFPRCASDIEEARLLLGKEGKYIGIIAKIERAEAIHNIDEIIEASDAVMVARGDLGVEIGEAEVPAMQKHIIQRARALVKPVITATQMMESMITSNVPTRAEVSDVANAVLDGTDAVMLSAESAVGEHPDLVVEAMARICVGAEKYLPKIVESQVVPKEFKRADRTIAAATMFAADHMDVKAILALTESGATPLWMSRIRSGIPIYGFSRHAKTRAKMTLYRDVYPIAFDVTKLNRNEINRKAVEELERHHLAKKGDWVILTKGDHLGIHGGTNAMKILEVGKIN